MIKWQEKCSARPGATHREEWKGHSDRALGNLFTTQLLAVMLSCEVIRLISSDWGVFVLSSWRSAEASPRVADSPRGGSLVLKLDPGQNAPSWCIQGTRTAYTYHLTIRLWRIHRVV